MNLSKHMSSRQCMQSMWNGRIYLWLRRLMAGTRAAWVGERGVSEGFTVGTGKLPHINPSCTAGCALCTCSCPTYPSWRIVLTDRRVFKIFLSLPVDDKYMQRLREVPLQTLPNEWEKVSPLQRGWSLQNNLAILKPTRRFYHPEPQC